MLMGKQIGKSGRKDHHHFYLVFVKQPFDFFFVLDTGCNRKIITGIQLLDDALRVRIVGSIQYGNLAVLQLIGERKAKEDDLHDGHAKENDQ